MGNIINDMCYGYDAPTVEHPLVTLQKGLERRIAELLGGWQDPKAPSVAACEAAYKAFADQTRGVEDDQWHSGEVALNKMFDLYANRTRYRQADLSVIFGTVRENFLARIGENQDIPPTLRSYAHFVSALTNTNVDHSIASALRAVEIARDTRHRDMFGYQSVAVSLFNKFYTDTRNDVLAERAKTRRAHIRQLLKFQPWIKEGHPARVHDFFLIRMN